MFSSSLPQDGEFKLVDSIETSVEGVEMSPKLLLFNREPL